MSDSNNKGISKLINCNVHGPIRLTPNALAIINTQEFHRLRYIRQLGCVYLVNPSAMHSRFEHSIGVYHLTGLFVERIRKLYSKRLFDIPILGGPVIIDDKIAEMITIAGLCHDIGHGPFSHCFDDVFLNSPEIKLKIEKYKDMALHENRSCEIMDRIIKRELSDTYEQKHIDFIKSLIDPDMQKKECSAIYQIVANSLNGLDVDKFDYLLRDSQNIGLKQGLDVRRIMNEFIVDEKDNICFPKHSSMDIYEIFSKRYMMHRQIYNHKTVKILELMFADIMKLIDPIVDLSGSLSEIEKFCRLTDNYIISVIDMYSHEPLFQTLSEGNKERIMKAKDIYNNIIRRDLYRMITDIEYGNIENTIKKIRKFLVEYPQYDSQDFELIVYKIGLVSGDKPDPFSKIFFYDKIEDPKTFTMKRTDISHLITEQFQEKACGLICKDKNICDEARDNWLRGQWD